MKLHWGNAIVIFFALFLTLAAVFIVFSFRQNNDLEDDDYYEKGAAYSQQIEINNRSAIFIDSILISNDGQHLNLVFCEYILNNTSEIKVLFYRPSEKRGDYKILLKTENGDFAVNKTHLKKGRYIVKLKWSMSSLDYEVKKDIFID